MTWTYSGDPATSDKDEVRFLVGDTAITEPLLQDEEILYLLSVTPDQGPTVHNYVAAAAAAKALAAKFAKERDKTVGSLSMQHSQRYDHYLQLSTDLMEMATTGIMSRPGGVAILGGGGPTYLGGYWP